MTESRYSGEATKVLGKQQSRLHWASCSHDTALFLHCCDARTAHKGPHGQSLVPRQQYNVGAPMESQGGHLGPFSHSDAAAYS